MFVVLFLIALVFGLLISFVEAFLCKWLVGLVDFPFLQDLTYWQWFVLCCIVSMLTTHINWKD